MTLALPKPRKVRKVPRPLRRGAKPKARSMSKAAQERRAADREWADKVKALNPDECFWCHSLIFGYGDAHHLFARRTYPSLRHVVSNGVHLHRDCHEWAHRHPKGFKHAVKVLYAQRWAALERKARK